MSTACGANAGWHQTIYRAKYRTTPSQRVVGRSPPPPHAGSPQADAAHLQAPDRHSRGLLVITLFASGCDQPARRQGQYQASGRLRRDSVAYRYYERCPRRSGAESCWGRSPREIARSRCPSAYRPQRRPIRRRDARSTCSLRSLLTGDFITACKTHACESGPAPLTSALTPPS